MKKTLQQTIDEICTDAMKEEVARMFVLWEIERQVLRGEILVPELPPLRDPFVFRA